MPVEAMTEPIATEVPQVPICATQKCKRRLTFLGPPQNCWRCLVCNPITKTSKTGKPKRDKYIDVTITDAMVREIIKEEIGSVSAGLNEEQIREIVQDELANWHIQKPPATRDEIAETVSVSEGLQQYDEKGKVTSSILTLTPVTKPVKDWAWLQKAKSLGIRTHNEGTGGMRKKVDILADMERLGELPEEAENGVQEELRTEEQG